MQDEIEQLIEKEEVHPSKQIVAIGDGRPAELAQLLRETADPDAKPIVLDTVASVEKAEKPEKMIVLKHDENGEPVYISMKEFTRIMGKPRKLHGFQKDSNRVKKRKQAKQSRKKNRRK